MDISVFNVLPVWLGPRAELTLGLGLLALTALLGWLLSSLPRRSWWTLLLLCPLLALWPVLLRSS